MLNKFRFPARKASSSSSNLAGVESSATESHDGGSMTTTSASLNRLADVENVPPAQTAARSASSEHLAEAPRPSKEGSAGVAAPKKTRRKSYGGIRAMLGKTRTESVSEPPPVPTIPISSAKTSTTSAPTIVESTSRSAMPSRSPKGKQLYVAPGSDTRSQTSLSSAGEAMPFPTATQTSPNLAPVAEPRPSTSSLKPFPFLGMRRKSSNSNVPGAGDGARKRPPSPGFLFGVGGRLPSYSSKKAQSVDDLSQFGILPDGPSRAANPAPEKQGRRGPRRSVELERSGGKGGPGDLHGSLDRIGEMAGSLAGMPSPQGDRHPRLSNPKGMRTVYGVPLQDLFWRDGEEFPLLLNTLVNLVEEHGITQQGIYRVPGEKKVIEELQVAVDERGVRGVNIWRASQRDVHNVTGAIGLWLREVPEGVVPFAHYDDFIAVSAVKDEEERTGRLRQLVRALPPPNRLLLQRLMQHFVVVVQNASGNNMLAHNLAIVFAPSLFRSGSENSNPLLMMQNIGRASVIVRHLIVRADAIFAPAAEDDGDVDEDALSSSAKGDEDSTVSTVATSNAPPPEITKTAPEGRTGVAGDDEDVERLATPMLGADGDEGAQIGIAA